MSARTAQRCPPTSKQECAWAQARRRSLVRYSGASQRMEPIDRGANYFIEALERLGAQTFYSCEGHPTGFYILFEAPYDTALGLEAAGYFSVEIEGRNRWSLRINGSEKALGDRFSEADRNRILSGAAAAWERVFFSEGRSNG